MSDHHTEEQEHAHPEECDTVHERDHCCLFSNQNVGDQRCGDDEDGQRCERIAACDEHVLKCTFTVEQCCETPVSDYPEKERKCYGCKSHKYVNSRGLAGEDIAGTYCLIEECEDRDHEDDISRTNAAALFMLEIPVTVEGVSHNVDSVDKLLHDILLTDLEGNLFILLSCIAKELSDEDESYYYNCGDNEEPLGHPLLSNLLIGVRVAAVVVSCLIVFHSAVVVTVAEHRGCDTDVSYVEVIVSLKDLGPVVNLGVIVSVVLVFQSLNENIAVLGTSVNCEASVILIEKDEVVALIANSLDIGDGTDLVTGVTEGKEEVTLRVVCKYLTSLLVDDGPGALGGQLRSPRWWMRPE